MFKFCTRSCNASYNNKRRDRKIYEKLSQTLKGRASKNKKFEILGSYCKVFNMTCAHCGTKFIARTAVKYCNLHSNLYKQNNRNRYAFTFSIRDYPDLFDSYVEDLSKYGMWTPTNTNGLTRDHRISVNEAIRNNYDPYYIKHPLNCELMTWYDNNTKNTNSSLTYDELVQLVNEYDQNKSNSEK